MIRASASLPGNLGCAGGTPQDLSRENSDWSPLMDLHYKRFLECRSSGGRVFDNFPQPSLPEKGHGELSMGPPPLALYTKSWSKEPAVGKEMQEGVCSTASHFSIRGNSHAQSIAFFLPGLEPLSGMRREGTPLLANSP